MRIIILTTDTFHHTYYIQELIKRVKLEAVFVEKKKIKPQFEIAHKYEEDRYKYESKYFFHNKDVKIKDLTEVQEFEDINDEDSISLVKKINPDIIIVFGTGVVKKELINIFNERIVNLHGGNPELYRGLDSHLWSIYHNDFNNLITVIHLLRPELDTGEIILKSKIPLFKNMKLYQLQAENTKICIELSLGAIAVYKELGKFIYCSQNSLGRYYSFIPSSLKEVCIQKFNKYIEKTYGL